MSPFRAAHAAGGSWSECVAQCAERLGRPGGGLGFVYFTDALLPHAVAIVDSLRERTGVADWVGTVGIGVIASGTEYLDQPGLSTMVAELPGECYRVFSGRNPLARIQCGLISRPVVGPTRNRHFRGQHLA